MRYLDLWAMQRSERSTHLLINIPGLLNPAAYKKGPQLKKGPKSQIPPLGDFIKISLHAYIGPPIHRPQARIQGGGKGALGPPNPPQTIYGSTIVRRGSRGGAKGALAPPTKSWIRLYGPTYPYLPTYLPTYIPTYIHTYIHSHTYIHVYIGLRMYIPTVYMHTSWSP